MMFCLNVFLFFFFFFMNSIYLFFFEYVIYINNGSYFTLVFFFDWVSLLFMSFVFLISGSVLLYSVGYMSCDLNIVRFFYLVFLFILSMIFFIMMPDLICLLLGWDGLGIISYLLVIYYQNNISLYSGLITIFINRLGDVFIILSIGFFFNFGSWHFFYYVDFLDFNIFFLIYFLMFSSFTKSAQFPFSFWLPLAMAAPTPVSSLVHSSTLVTSGLYLMIRFSHYVYYYDTFFLSYISLLTMFFSSFSAVMENDLKKIIAFSTLSQLSFMFFILSFGSISLCFSHLLIHAVFKSLLFLCSGYFIHCFFGSQDIRYMGGMVVQCPFVSSCFFVSLLSLMGFPFFSGFFSSDIVIEMFVLMHMNYVYFFFFSFCLGLTFMYSLRLMYYLFYSDSYFFSFVTFKYSFYMNFSLLFLFFSSLIFGSFIFWMFYDFFFFVGGWLSMLPFYSFFFFFFFNFLFNFFYILNFFFFYFFGLIMFLNFFSSDCFMSLFFSVSSLSFYLVDVCWLEYFIFYGLKNFFYFFSFYLDKFILNYFKIYFFSFFFFIIFFIFF
nr:NADH dehydrogenase subunit 5 [Tettigometridae sp.]